MFRSLLLAEFNGSAPLCEAYWEPHSFRGLIADPFMGGGTPVIEANRMGFNIIGCDVNPMAAWIVRQSLAQLDIAAFLTAADEVAADVELELGYLYRTLCVYCGDLARVKYFLWVKTEACACCGAVNDLFPGYLLAEAVRHPRHVLLCGACGELNEYDQQPTRRQPAACRSCGGQVSIEGPARKQRMTCRSCGSAFGYPRPSRSTPPQHRMWAIEYHCATCRPSHEGRFFKKPDGEDLARFQEASAELAGAADLPIPDDTIPPGDETTRLHRWGYKRYREMFNSRQLLGLGVLLRRILRVEHVTNRHALLTVFSDFLRYQNLLCRYDTYALKCQDIFSVHGFPVGLVQCEDDLLGIPGIGSGSFRHFVQKYERAKRYCISPFETHQDGTKKRIVSVPGERIGAQFVRSPPMDGQRRAFVQAAHSASVQLLENTLDGVFTDPPYFDNVQYAELMDFCFVWLRLGLNGESAAFGRESTRSPDELTGNETLGRGLDHFTAGLSAVFRCFAAALKPGAPFVFTYHHNDWSAYVPLVVAILDAGLDCTATLPTAGEMSASLHISGTGSSVLDSVFVCRKCPGRLGPQDLAECLDDDVAAMRRAGVRVGQGDVRCLVAGHVARMAINRLRPTWSEANPLIQRMGRASEALRALATETRSASVVTRLTEGLPPRRSAQGSLVATAV